MHVVPVLLTLVDRLSSIRVYIPKDLKSKENKKATGKALKEVMKRFSEGVPLLDPIEDMKIKDESFLKLIRKVELLEDRLMSNPIVNNPNLKDLYAKYEKKTQLQLSINELQAQIRNLSANVIHKNSLKCMKRVLRRLGHVSSSNVIELKGRVACEISTADELLATELLFNGTFNELNVEQAVALVSCLVCTEKAESKAQLREELMTPLRQLQEAARRVALVVTESKMPLDADEYVGSFKPHMMELVYAWCKGAKFIEICKMTKIFEGSIIRAMRRIEEVLRQLATASKLIGNAELENKFESGIAKLKRDVVFSASLFL
eukprot:TRINITY_DN1019_c0_g2_i4.p1 TRINITY_DN1019_c0_g2~~TRINITY_DN1019_c0_g2_i4.p1  ORF type:complete len:319 (+),score=80.01 TRINITY_DN1019_c0_g2_i4:154-1110(+)